MRKFTLALVAFWALCATFVSCSKDESVIKFKASCERSTAKTDLNANDNGYYLTWADGDRIIVYGENDSCVLTTTSTGRTATFTGNHEGEFHSIHGGHIINEPDADANHNHYHAAYPVSQWSMNRDGDHYYYRLRLPENQTYKANNVENYPMFAVCEESASNIDFKNVCGILEINVSGELTGIDAGARVAAIQISAEQPLCGDFVVASFTSNGEPLIHEYTEVGHHFHYNTVELRCPTNPTLANGKFMIVLPPSNYDHFKIEIFTTNHHYTKLTLQNGSNVLIERSKVTPINITANQLHFENDPYVPSLFSVSEDRQVRFAKGNVYYDNGTWGMFDEQWGFYSTISETCYDHFGRSLGENNNYGITSDYNEIYSTCGESENFVDWGTLFPDYYGGGWRTLTHDELYYVTYNRRNAQNLFAYATVCGIEGLLLLPDEWVPVSGINLALGDNHYFYSNNIDATAWTRLENAGAVFLPCAGSIISDDHSITVSGNSGNSVTSGSMIFGCYWCSDTQDAYYELEGVRYPQNGYYSNSTFSFGFTSFADEEGDAGDHRMHRWYSTCQGVGNTVRLVQDAGWVSNSASGSAKGKRK